MHSPHPYNGLPGVHLSTVESGWVRFEKCIGALFRVHWRGNRPLFMPHIPLFPVPMHTVHDRTVAASATVRLCLNRLPRLCHIISFLTCH